MTTQLATKQVRLLPLLYRQCNIPGFLRGKLYADFTDVGGYDVSLAKVFRTIGLDSSRGIGGTLFDPYAEEFGRHKSLYSRPIRWHCIFCGKGPMAPYNDYICVACDKPRPFMGGSCTVRDCPSCRQRNLLFARFCEWCGSELSSIDGAA